MTMAMYDSMGDTHHTFSQPALTPRGLASEKRPSVPVPEEDDRPAGEHRDENASAAALHRRNQPLGSRIWGWNMLKQSWRKWIYMRCSEVQGSQDTRWLERSIVCVKPNNWFMIEVVPVPPGKPLEKRGINDQYTTHICISVLTMVCRVPWAINQLCRLTDVYCSGVVLGTISSGECSG